VQGHGGAVQLGKIEDVGQEIPGEYDAASADERYLDNDSLRVGVQVTSYRFRLFPARNSVAPFNPCARTEEGSYN
jgi:hypothetical protein